MAQWEREKYQDRYITKFDGENTYIPLDRDYVFSGDFRFRFKTYQNVVATAEMILGNSSGTSNCIFTNNNELNVRDGSNETVYTTGGLIPSGSLNDIFIERIGTSIAIYVNDGDTPVATGTLSGSFTFNMIGARKSPAEYHFNGRIAELVMHDETDTCVFASRLNHPTLCINEVGLGDELISGNPSYAGNATIEGSTVTSTNGSWGYIYWDIPTVAGEQYLLKINTITSNGQWALTVWSKPDYGILVNVTEYADFGEVLFTATSSETRVAASFLGVSSGDTIQVTKASVVHAPGSAEIINPEVDPPLFSYNSSTDPDQWQTSDQSVVIPIAQPEQVN